MLPSFCAQANRGFRWIVLFHKDISEERKARIEGYRNKIIYLNHDFIMMNNLKVC